MTLRSLCRPPHASVRLAQTFPYNENQLVEDIQAIVVHVVDPGVGNIQDGPKAHYRALILRKDGVLFIGPDNGTLSFACPKGSVKAAWKINIDLLNHLSGVDTKAGGTFHGRDLFAEAALRIAAKTVTPDQIGIAYTTQDISCRLDQTVVYQKTWHDLQGLSPLKFVTFDTSRAEIGISSDNAESLFEKAFLLGVIQSPLYDENEIKGKTNSKKIFLIQGLDHLKRIAIFNQLTGNLYIGPNNGLGTSFFKGFPRHVIQAWQVSDDLVQWIDETRDTEAVYRMLKTQPNVTDALKEIEFEGDELHVTRDLQKRPITLYARVWLDPYGNLKTTAVNTLLDEVQKNPKVSVELEANGIQHKAIFAETFSQVPKDALFIYNGSTGAIGPNPHRSFRYVEVTANGVYGIFGAEFFSHQKRSLKNGDRIKFSFTYSN